MRPDGAPGPVIVRASFGKVRDRVARFTGGPRGSRVPAVSLAPHGLDELGLGGLANLLSRMRGGRASDCVDTVMKLFENGRLTTHDDATLMVVTAAGLEAG